MPMTYDMSLKRRVAIGAYQDTEVIINVRGISPETTEDEIERMIASTEMTFGKMNDTLSDKVNAVRRKAREELKDG